MNQQFSTEASNAISILLPTRGRGETAFKSLRSLVDLADNPKDIEFLVALDHDDVETRDYFVEHVVDWFNENELNLTVYQTERYGYLQLHKYNNFLGSFSTGRWIIFWNDDAIMQSKGWDTDICEYDGQFKVLAFDTHNQHPYSIFPILPRDWISLFEQLSPHQQTDAWVSQIAWLTDCMVRLDTKVLHDRADLTGNNDDETYKQRQYREGDVNDPMDINNPATHAVKLQWVAKLAWFLKCINQDTGWFDRWTKGEVDPWQKMLAFDVNKQVMITRVTK